MSDKRKIDRLAQAALTACAAFACEDVRAGFTSGLMEAIERLLEPDVLYTTRHKKLFWDRIEEMAREADELDPYFLQL